MEMIEAFAGPLDGTEVPLVEHYLAFEDLEKVVHLYELSNGRYEYRGIGKEEG